MKKLTAVILNDKPLTKGWVADYFYDDGSVIQNEPICVTLGKTEEYAINSLRIARGNETYSIAVLR
jgi:hypothetical protein